ncbi:hypothetical protein OA07_07155 [Aphanizomenon flos-aquae 2012/KM1/D3]|nr:hypothetical protein OA07_07155 [Aphanizomenon flos-aquae 2012/KM1/D3]
MPYYFSPFIIKLNKDNESGNREQGTGNREYFYPIPGKFWVRSKSPVLFLVSSQSYFPLKRLVDITNS